MPKSHKTTFWKDRGRRDKEIVNFPRDKEIDRQTGRQRDRRHGDKQTDGRTKSGQATIVEGTPMPRINQSSMIKL